MKLIIPFVFAAIACAGAEKPELTKQDVLAPASRNGVEVKLDLPYAGNTNPKQMVDLYLPKKPNSDKALPVVAVIHGGGWMNGDRLRYYLQAVELACTGNYAAVSVGYRLSGEAKWPAQIHDCKAAIRWIRAHAKEYNLDPDKIAVWGSSAGGHLVSLLGTSGDVKELEGDLGPDTGVSSRVQCVVNLCGPQDLTKALMFDKSGKPIVNDNAVVGLLGGTFEEKHADAVAASPLTYVSKDDPPFINIQGTDDRRVSFTNAEAIHAALQKVGVTSLLVPLKDGGHASIGNAEGKARALAFLDQVLRGIDSTISTTPIETRPAAKAQPK